MPAPELDTHLDTELAAERAHLDTSRAALGGCANAPRPCSPPATRWPATRTPPRRSAARWPAGSPSWPTTRHPAVLRPARLRATEPDAGARGHGDFHIGRRHVTDDAGEPLVIDWRAPVSRPFYRASRGTRRGWRSGAGSASPAAS